VWDTAILVPVEDVWQVHGLKLGHAADGSPHIGPPWDAQGLAGVPAIAVKPDSIAAAYRLRGQFQNARSVALFPAEVLNDLYLTLGNVRDLMSLLAISTQVLMALLVGFLAPKRQFAVLRDMGAGRAYVFSVVWIEVTLLGWGSSLALAQWMKSLVGFDMPVRLGQAEGWLVAGLVVAGTVIGLLPA
jgi:putative ABC transport system permease protein